MSGFRSLLFSTPPYRVTRTKSKSEDDKKKVDKKEKPKLHDTAPFQVHSEEYELRTKISLQEQKIHEQENLIKRLEEALVTLKEEIDFLATTPVQTVVKDLAKKNKQLRLECQREKDKYKGSQIETMITEINALKEKNSKLLNDKENTSDAETIKGLSMELDEIKDQAKQSANRAAMLRTQLSVSDNQCKKLKAALRKEIGSDIDVNLILNENSQWKGRSDTIAHLRAQLKSANQQILELKESKSNQHKNNRHPKIVREEGEPDSPHAIPEKSDNVLRLEKELKQHIHMSAHAIKTLRGALEKEVKENKVLKMQNRELKKVKQKLKEVLTKWETKGQLDDILISKLQQQAQSDMQKMKELNHKRPQYQLAQQKKDLESLQALASQRKDALRQSSEENERLSQEIVRLSNFRTDKFQEAVKTLLDHQEAYETEYYRAEVESLKKIVAEYKATADTPREHQGSNSSRMTKGHQELLDDFKLVSKQLQAQSSEVTICYDMMETQKEIHCKYLQKIDGQLCFIRSMVDHL